jgi:hypothetical protein
MMRRKAVVFGAVVVRGHSPACAQEDRAPGCEASVHTAIYDAVNAICDFPFSSFGAAPVVPHRAL